jgi:hypothetical protein
MIVLRASIISQIILLLFVLFIAITTRAQDNSVQIIPQTEDTKVLEPTQTEYISPLVIQLNYQYGFLIPHADEVFNVAGRHPQSLKLYFGPRLLIGRIIFILFWRSFNL